MGKIKKCAACGNTGKIKKCAACGNTGIIMAYTNEKGQRVVVQCKECKKKIIKELKYGKNPNSV